MTNLELSETDETEGYTGESSLPHEGNIFYVKKKFKCVT
jgi:hypothetical protein